MGRFAATGYGINRNILEVESVSEMRGGRLTKWDKDAIPRTATTRPGSQTRTEVLIVFGLIDVVDFSMFHNEESKKKAIEELTAKAAQMKSERDAQAGGGSATTLSLLYANGSNVENFCAAWIATDQNILVICAATRVG